jgi:hypothetical protein
MLIEIKKKAYTIFLKILKWTKLTWREVEMWRIQSKHQKHNPQKTLGIPIFG